MNLSATLNPRWNKDAHELTPKCDLHHSTCTGGADIQAQWPGGVVFLK